jgi:hypothetical protein
MAPIQAKHPGVYQGMLSPKWTPLSDPQTAVGLLRFFRWYTERNYRHSLLRRCTVATVYKTSTDGSPIAGGVPMLKWRITH